MNFAGFLKGSLVLAIVLLCGLAVASYTYAGEEGMRGISMKREAALPEEDALGQEVPQDLSEAELLADEAAAEEALGASEFSYVSVNGGISVTGYNGTAANVTIPSSINGKTVVSVGEEAFRQKPVTRVTLPATLTSLGRKCFYGCESLEVVNLGSCPTPKTIG